jgi:hypothetical protein
VCSLMRLLYIVPMRMAVGIVVIVITILIVSKSIYYSLEAHHYPIPPRDRESSTSSTIWKVKTYSMVLSCAKSRKPSADA